MAGNKRVLRNGAMPLDKTSSLNQHFLCDYCGLKFNSKAKLPEHLASCVEVRTCTQCNLVFKNRGILFSHSNRIHGFVSQVSKTTENYPCEHCPKSYKYKKLLNYHLIKVHNADIKLRKRRKTVPAGCRYECRACQKSYKYEIMLRHHIRAVHFNLLYIEAEGVSRKVNEVWYERVLNSDMVVRIKKTGKNRYVLERTVDNGTVDICVPKQAEDIKALYPLKTKHSRMYCYICKRYFYMELEKHIEKCHGPSELEKYRRNMTVGLQRLEDAKKLMNTPKRKRKAKS